MYGGGFSRGRGGMGNRGGRPKAPSRGGLHYAYIVEFLFNFPLLFDAEEYVMVYS